MKKIFSLVVLFALFSVTLSAQSYFENKTPYQYLSQQTKIVNNPVSTCNKGAEPFSVFRKKWNSDYAFRRARVKDVRNCRIDAGSATAQLNYLREGVSGLQEENFKISAYPTKRVDGGSSWRSYFGVNANYVGVCDYFNSDDGWEASLVLGFMRIEGKWYLVYFRGS